MDANIPLMGILFVGIVALTNAVASFTQKVATDHGWQSRQLFILYAWALTIALVIAAVRSQLIWNVAMVQIFVIGIANAYGGYCQWKAIQISMIRNSLFGVMPSLFSMALAFVLLGEAKHLTSLAWSGMGICALAVAVFTISRYVRKRKEHQDDGSTLALIQYIASYAVIWGITGFLLKTDVVQELDVAQFMLGMYCGSFVTATTLMILLSRQEREKHDAPLDLKKTIPLLGVLAVCIVTWVGVSYFAYKHFFFVMVAPITMVITTVVPVIISILFFKKERNELTKFEWAVLSMGILGIVILALQLK